MKTHLSAKLVEVDQYFMLKLLICIKLMQLNNNINKKDRSTLKRGLSQNYIFVGYLDTDSSGVFICRPSKLIPIS